MKEICIFEIILWTA